MNSPVFAPIMQRQTHVYDGQQSKSILLAATDNRTKTPKRKTMTRNGSYSYKLLNILRMHTSNNYLINSAVILELTASATGLRTTATAGKHDCETNLTGGGELGYVVL